MAKRGPKPMAEELRKTNRIATFRLGKAELSEVERLAQERGLSRSELLRSIVTGAIATQKKNEAALRLHGTSAQGMEVTLYE